MLARVEVERKRYKEALSALDRAIKIAPDSAALQMDRAGVLLASGDPKGAVAAAQAVVKAHPNDASAHGRLGDLLATTGDRAGARQAYAKSLELSNADAQILNNAAWLEVEAKGDLAKAFAWAKRATELQPKVAGYFDTLAWVERARGDLPKAEAALNQALELAPRSATFHYHLGIVRSELGAKAKAVESLEQALKGGLTPPLAEDAKQRLATLKK
jgi:Flp pilus assembly protein TadD